MNIFSTLHFLLATTKAQRKQLYTEQLFDELTGDTDIESVKSLLMLGVNIHAVDDCERSLRRTLDTHKLKYRTYMSCILCSI